MPKNQKHSTRKLYTVGPNAPFQFNEAYKSLRTNLEFLSATSDCKVILVTSSMPEEGKSNVSINLAQTLSVNGKRVILVDGDLRKGTLSRYMHVPKNRPGLTNRFAGQVEWNDVLMSYGKSSLLILPTGALPPNPSEMLSSALMKKLFEELRSFADYIIIDTPPVPVVTDAAVMSSFTDGAILVVRPGITTIQSAQLTKKKLEAVNTKILGVVVNGYDIRKSVRKDGYYYSYSSYDYYNNEDETPAQKTQQKRK